MIEVIVSIAILGIATVMILSFYTVSLRVAKESAAITRQSMDSAGKLEEKISQTVSATGDFIRFDKKDANGNVIAKDAIVIEGEIIQQDNSALEKPYETFVPKQ